MPTAPRPSLDINFTETLPPTQAEPWIRLALVMVAPVLLLLVGIALNR